MSKSRKLQH